jgi:hypothetical protein
MTKKTNISDIEIKLINATRKFAAERAKEKEFNSYTVEIFNNTEKEVSGIVLRDLLQVCYSKNGKKGPINVYVDRDLCGRNDFRNRYIRLLSQEIPEIKDRIKLGDEDLGSTVIFI